MEDSTPLSELFTESQAPEVVEQEQVEQVAQAEEVPAEMGEQDAAPPAEQPEKAEEPKADKEAGINAALIAERRRRQQAEQHAAQTQKTLEEMQQRFNANPHAQPEQPKGEPKPEQFESWEQYVAALTQHNVGQALRQAHENEQRQRTEHQQRKQIEQIQSQAMDVVGRGQQKYPDFDAVVNGGLAPFLNESLHLAITQNPVGEDIAHHLGRNPAEAQRLSSLPPYQVIREIALLEAKLTQPPKPTIPKTLTNTRDVSGRFAGTARPDVTPLESLFKR
jgi:chemotaxis protein histidine kinase CheA